jgi:hypothetical protein
MAALNRLPMWMLVATWLVVGTALPALDAWVYGVRDPQDVLVHDEHTYLLQADTFARGRLTNRPPRHPEFFESPHILVDPSYQAKYPPAQGVFLAFGQRFLGHPIWGVWLSCGLFAGALYWMLSGWTNRLWAMLGTEFAVAVLGVTHYWATTYWGGMVAACGGALVLGGTRWTLRQWSAGRGLLTGLGMVILANSRPYEGGVVFLACAPALAWWLLSGSGQQRRQKVICWCGPFLLVVAAGAVGMAVYNQAVTGSWKTLPYALHQKQYTTFGMLRWQPINQIPERRLTTRVRFLYEADGLMKPGTPGGPQLGAVALGSSLRQAFLDLFRNFISPLNLVPRNEVRDSSTDGLSLLIVFVAMTAWFLCSTKRWGLLHAAWSILTLEVLAGGAAWWNLCHYQAPIVCLCYFLAIDWVRRTALVLRRARLLRFIRVRQAILVLIVLIPTVLLESRFDRLFPDLGASPANDVVGAPPLPSASRGLTRPQLLDFLARQKRPALAIVSYDPGIPLCQEWVYNSADLESQRVVLAHDLGPKKLPLLVADFLGRDVWRVRVTPQGATVQCDDAGQSALASVQRPGRPTRKN